MSTVEVITEELVRSLAPNPAAFANAQKISRSGDFSGLSVTADKTLIFGECKGSGKNPYRTSADFSGESPICRCSCPSRQFPCKHALALMLEYSSGKTFAQADVPEDVAAKRSGLSIYLGRAMKYALPSVCLDITTNLERRMLSCSGLIVRSNLVGIGLEAIGSRLSSDEISISPPDDRE